jgi:hypothetical protein
MRWIKPPSCSNVAGAGGVEHAAGAEEQQALEQRMIEHMK